MILVRSRLPARLIHRTLDSALNKRSYGNGSSKTPAAGARRTGRRWRAAAGADAQCAPRTTATSKHSFEVVKTDAQWRELLTPAQYSDTAQGRHRSPFSSPLDHEKRAGTSRAPAAGCRCSPRRPSSTAAPAGRVSGSRWTTPSGRVRHDARMSRVEVLCRRCGGHLATSSRTAPTHRAALLHERPGDEIHPRMNVFEKRHEMT